MGHGRLGRRSQLAAIRCDEECVTFFLSGATTFIRVAKAESQSSVSTHGANQIICSIRGILRDMCRCEVNLCIFAKLFRRF